MVVLHRALETFPNIIGQVDKFGVAPHLFRDARSRQRHIENLRHFSGPRSHVAGGLRGAAVKLAKCETIDVEVPAFSEVVIEGITIPGERVADGPYGEYPGCYSEAKQAPVLKVTAITMRQNPIWQTALTGMPVTENHTLIEYGNAAVVYREVKKVVPEVRGVNMITGYELKT